MIDNFFDFVSRDSFNECLENDARNVYFYFDLELLIQLKKTLVFTITLIFLICQELMCILHKFSICRLKQIKREHIPINVRCFKCLTFKDSSDEYCGFAALSEIFACF